MGAAQGSLPPEWGAAGAFPALRYLEVSSNFRLTGQLPDGWGANAGSMQRLQVLLAHDCNLTGTLPASWAANLPALGALDLTYNLVSGACWAFSLLGQATPSPVSQACWAP